MSYGIIEYSDDGLIKCEICNQYFQRVITHVRQKHYMNEKDYNLQFGFDTSKGICSRESAERSRIKVYENFDKCIGKNLLEKGSNTRFIVGSKGRTKDMVSYQTNLSLKRRLDDYHLKKNNH